MKNTRFQEPSFHLSDFLLIGHTDAPPPREVKIEDLVSQRLYDERITVQAEVEDYFIDDIDTRYYYLSLKSGPHRVYGTIARTNINMSHLDDLLGATVRLTGVVGRQSGARRFVGNRIAINSQTGIKIITPAEKDLSRVPQLGKAQLSLPMEIVRLSRHRISGSVLAVWRRARMLVRSADGQIVDATLRSPASLPRVGDTVVVAGYPSTDFFHISLSGARWQPYPATGTTSAYAGSVPDCCSLFTDFHGNHSIESTYHGKVGRIQGKVLRKNNDELEIEQGADTVKVLSGEGSSCFRQIEPGSIVDVAGIVVLESDVWREGGPLPRIKGVSIVTRKAADIGILQHPPWWTPGKVLAALSACALLVFGLFSWNRVLMRIVVRRSRELTRNQLARERSDLKADERTRLAIELHDSLSQNLSGLGCQLVSIRSTLPADNPASYRLKTAERMLLSTRTELKRCLFDLRTDLLEDTDFEHALRRMLQSTQGTCRLRIKFHIARSLMNDSLAHAVLSIVRELASNAICHGHATTVAVAGTLAHASQQTVGNWILFSVRDNGAGFDPDGCAGPAEGHFGLAGIRDRVDRASGKFTIVSKSGATYARISLPL